MSDDNGDNGDSNDKGDDYDDLPEYSLSASRIKAYRNCPEKFRMRYIEELDGTKKAKGYGILGSVVHKTIETVLEDASELTLRDEYQLAGRLKSTFNRLKDELDYDWEKVDDKQEDDGLKCLETAATFITARDFEVRDIEARTVFQIENAEYGIEANVLGYIDVTTDGEVWDWKTGRIRDDTAQEEIIQGSVYMAGYHNLYGEMPEAVRFVYLKEEQVRSIDVSEDNWKTMLSHARRLVDGKQQDEYEAKPEDGKCYFCSYEGYCGASPVGAGQIDRWEQF